MIELGTHITYTHQAAVVRKKDGKWKFDRKQNGNIPRELYENQKGLFWIGFTPYTQHVPVEFMQPEETRASRTITPEVTERFNKSVVAWEVAGAGTVTGLIRKEIGISTEGGGGHVSMYGEGEWEPGWFTRYGKVDLYVVRHELRGTAFVYVPTWAAAPVVS